MIKMASDHLRVNIEFLSGGPLLQRGLLLYSPSTVKTLKEELSHAHDVAMEEIAVYFDGQLMGDAVRMVDKRLYHVRLPPKWKDPLSGEEGLGLGLGLGVGLGKGVVAIEKGVTFEEGVHVDSMIEVDTAPVVQDARVYIAFAFAGLVRLFDVTHGAVLSPTPSMRLGYVVLYADWARLRSFTKEVPTDPITWLYDRVRRDYGILATSSLFALDTAPLAELRRYHVAMEGWMARQPVEGETGMEGEMEESELEMEEDEVEEDEMEEDEMEIEEMGIELDDSEWWR